jgi:hypothetical protein
VVLEDRDGDESHECRSASLTRGMRAAHCAPTVYESNVFTLQRIALERKADSPNCWKC